MLVSRQPSLVSPKTCRPPCGPPSAERSLRSWSQIIPSVKCTRRIPRWWIWCVPIEHRRRIPRYVHVFEVAIVETLNRNVAPRASLAFFCQPTQESRLQDGMQEPGGSPSWPRCLLIGQNQAPQFSTVRAWCSLAVPRRRRPGRSRRYSLDRHSLAPRYPSTCFFLRAGWRRLPSTVLLRPSDTLYDLEHCFVPLMHDRDGRDMWDGMSFLVSSTLWLSHHRPDFSLSLVSCRYRWDLPPPFLNNSPTASSHFDGDQQHGDWVWFRRGALCVTMAHRHVSPWLAAATQVKRI